MTPTIHSENMAECINKRNKKEKNIKPNCIPEYNKFMNDVDLAGQYQFCYAIHEKRIVTKNNGQTKQFSILQTA